MIGKESESESTVSLGEVKRILEDKKKEKELTYEQQLAYDHAKKFAGLEKGKEEKLKSALVGLGASEKTAFRIIDILPKSALTLRQILAHENKTFTDDEISKMLAAVKEHA